MLKIYNQPNCVITVLGKEDVITTSTTTWSDETSKDYGGNWIWGEVSQ